MTAGVLLQGAAPELIDSAGIELDTTLGSWDYLWNRPVSALAAAHDPVGPCGGAAAYRLPVFRELGGFDETLFAYWEDVDLALRFREAGWRCVLAPGARAVHKHGQTLGAASPTARRLEAFGRGYVLAKYRVGGRNPLRWAKIAALDWPVLAVHLVLRREAGPARERLRARSIGLRTPGSPRTTRAGDGRLRDRPAPAGRPPAPAVRRRPSRSLHRRCRQRRLTYGSVHGSEIETVRPFASSIHSTS